MPRESCNDVAEILAGANGANVPIGYGGSYPELFANHRAAGLADPAGIELVNRALAKLAAIKATAGSPRTGRQSGRTGSRERARARGLADVALCSVLSYAGLRRSEAAALVWGDVEASDDGSGLLWVRRSKADREVEGSARYLPPGGDGSPRGLPSGRCRARGSGVRALGPAGRPARVGRRPRRRPREGFSGHSGRTGLAAELSRSGASTHEIAAAGGWRSPGMVIRYTRKVTAKRGTVAKYLEGC